MKKLIKSNMLPLVCLLILLAVTALYAGLHAKYVKSVELEGNVIFKPGIAKSINLLESKVKRNGDGSYEFDEEAEKVQGNEYKAMPGVDIPKDPEITVIEKTEIPSYLYVEVVNTDTTGKISYTLNDFWEKLDDIEGENGGDVYVYTGTDYDEPIGILKDNIVIVSDQYAGNDFNLDFYAYMYQKIDDATAEEAFSDS